MEPTRLTADFDKRPPMGAPVRVRWGERAHPVLRIALEDHGEPYEPVGDVALEVWHEGGHASVPCAVDGCEAVVTVPEPWRGIRALYVSDTSEGRRATTADIPMTILEGCL